MKDYDKLEYIEGEEFSKLILNWYNVVNNRHDLMRLFDKNNINSQSNSIIKVLITNYEMVLGIGQKPIPYALDHLRYFEPIKSYLKLTDRVELTCNAKLNMTHFQDNIGRDQHKNSYGNFEIIINLSELYVGIHKLYKTEYDINELSESLFISFFHDDQKIFDRLCNHYFPEDITRVFNHTSDKLKDDEDNLSLFADFLEYRDHKGY